MKLGRIFLAAATDWPFPARLAGAFTALGARVEAIAPRTSPLRHAAAPARLHRFSPWRPLASLARALGEAAPDFVIACDDMMAGLLWQFARSRAEFAPLLDRSGFMAFPLLSARNDFLRQAGEAGVPTAETMALHSPGDLELAIAALGFPLVLKADGFWGGEGVLVAFDSAGARTALDRLSHPSHLRIMGRALRRRDPLQLARLQLRLPPRPGAQRFITGRPATSSIACWQGRVLAANHFDVVMAAGTGPATMIAPADDAVMARAAALVCARFNLSGLYGLDYMRNDEGELFLLEINPRATPTSHLALGPARDLAAALLTAIGHPVPDRPAVTRLPHIALFPQEMRRDPQSPYLAGAYHDLPLDDSGLAGALLPANAVLTGISPANSGISALSAALKPLSR